MRALLDVNILISYLLSPQHSAISRVVEAGILGRYTLLFPKDLLHELATRVRSKPYLAQRITPDQVAELAAILSGVSETIPRLEEEEIPTVTRDPKDDYLLAYALLGQADYLVTGDGDLLALAQVQNVKIVTARVFDEILRAPPATR